MDKKYSLSESAEMFKALDMKFEHFLIYYKQELALKFVSQYYEMYLEFTKKLYNEVMGIEMQQGKKML